MIKVHIRRSSTPDAKSAIAWRAWAADKWLTSYRLNALRTAAYSFFHPVGQTQLRLVLGCQRSGTTMLAGALALSPLVKAYGEGDPRYFHWDGAPRLSPLDDVNSRLEQERSPFTLLKPLCESQRADAILAAFPNAKAVWIFRHYEPCVRSHVRYYQQYHDGLAYVREMLNTGEPNWKNANLPASVADVLAWYSRRELNLETAYALYWLARNSLVDRLAPELGVKVVNFESILRDPINSLADTFDSLSIPFRPRYARLVKEPIFTPQRSPTLDIDDQVVQHCDSLFEKLQRRAMTPTTTGGGVDDRDSDFKKQPPRSSRQAGVKELFP